MGKISSNQLITVFNNLKESILLLKPDHNNNIVILDFNDPMRKFLAILFPEETPEKLKDNDFFSVLKKGKYISAEVKILLEEKLEESRGKKQPVKSWITFKIPKTSEKVVVEVNDIPIQKKNGEPELIILKFTEVPEITNTGLLEELQRNEIHLKESQKQAKTGSFEWDVSENKMYWSKGFHNVLSINEPKKNPTLEDFFDLFPKVLQKKINAFFRDLIMNQEDDNYLPLTLQKDKHLLLKAVKIYNRSGNQKIFGIIQDITEVKIVKENLLKKELLLKEVQNNAPIGTFEYNPEKKLFIWTHEIYDIYELPRKFKPTLENYLQILTAQEINQLKENFRKLENQSKNYIDFIQKFKNPKGKIKFLQIKCECKEDELGKEKLFGIVKDISRYKKAELEIIKRNKELSMITRILKKQNNDLFRLAFLISHSLRKPIANILGIIHLMNISGSSMKEKESYMNLLGLSADELDDVVREINEKLSSYLKKYSSQEKLEQGIYPEVRLPGNGFHIKS